MNAIHCTAQVIHDQYAALPESVTSAVRAVVVYALNAQGNVAETCFHSIANGDVLACFVLSENLTESQWLALVNQQIAQPMQPAKVVSIDPALGVFNCTMAQYQTVIGFMDDMGHLYKLKTGGKVDRVCTTDPNDGGRVTVKAVVSDAPTAAQWLASVSSVAVEVDNLTFDMP